MHRFRQVDVFGSEPLWGNPVAVVHDADDLIASVDGPEGVEHERLQRFARWTNLSETTFLLAPTPQGAAAGADYRLRIFTPDGELPFAGHPTLGSAHAWLEAGGQPSAPGGDVLVQECEAGLIDIRRGERLAFRAPPLVRSGPVDPGDLEVLVSGLGLEVARVVDSRWVDNGPGWVALPLADAQDVLDCRPDLAALAGFEVGLVGPYPSPRSPDEPAVEVRAFTTGVGIGEDPVTGSLNAGLAMWLAGDRLPSTYVASQGTVIGRRGRVHVHRDDADEVWVAGDTVTVLNGEAHLGGPAGRPRPRVG